MKNNTIGLTILGALASIILIALSGGMEGRLMMIASVVISIFGIWGAFRIKKENEGLFLFTVISYGIFYILEYGGLENSGFFALLSMIGFTIIGVKMLDEKQ
jgi:hypothetical protein